MGETPRTLKEMINLLYKSEKKCQLVCDCYNAFDGMTNGAVVKMLFPKATFVNLLETVYREESIKGYFETSDFHTTIIFPLRWWNAPYGKDGEDIE